MRKWWPFAVVAVLMVAILIVPLPAKALPQPAATSSRPNAVSTAPAPVATASADAKFDVTLSGGLVGHWQSTAAGPPRCNILGNALQATITTDVSGAKYGLVVRQNKLTPGTYTLPVTGDGADSPPSAQITTSANPKAQWDLGNGGAGQGTITLTGGTGGSLLSIAIDGDLADITGGKAIHVSGSISCHPVVS